ncbi:MAG: hypothetical protein IT385_04310 [Deltaproteobacteria bacterium]|nr:hypothetical protein [Deltaproteobacteria bacterium]
MRPEHALALAVAASSFPACGADTTAPCPPILERFGAPAPVEPGLAAPRVITAERRTWVDFDPVTRGEHAVVRLEDGPRCDVSVVVEPALTARAPTGLPADATIGDELARPGQAALVVVGADVDSAGPFADRQAWDAALAALGLRGRALVAPARAVVEDALVDTCVEAGRGVALLVFAGPGSPAAGGALVLGAEAISHDRIRELVATRCGDVGLVVIVLDSSWVPDARWAPEPAKLVWSASDPTRPDAARAGPHGGGALTAALAATLVERTATCARPADASPDELAGRVAWFAWLFRDEGVRARVLADRWSAIGLPALAALAARGALTPTTRDAIAFALERQVPTELVRVAPPPTALEACAGDADCAPLVASCGLGACERWACVAGRCALAPDVGAACDDGVACTVDDACDARGLCAGAPRPCDDGNPCTDDACEPGGCVGVPRVDAPCDDGDACTRDDACDAAGGCAGATVACDDGDPCTRDTCDPERPEGPCVFTPATNACDDANPCTLSDQCRDRICVGTAVACADDNACTADACDPETGACRFVPLADGAPCDDRDPCTTLDRCGQGTCRGLARACDDGLACTFDACDAGACTHLPSPGTCLSSVGCIPVGDEPPDDPCLTCAATDRLEPVPDGAPCGDDGIACTADRCEAGVCRHRDAPDACHDAAGRCVQSGEALTDCLVCVGGGVVSPASSGTPCGAPEGCARGACNGQGACLLPSPWPCCPVEVVTCGEAIVLDRPRLAGAARVAAWSCTDAPLPGPERHLSVTTPCAGDLALSLEGPSGQSGATSLLDVAPCPGDTCSAAAPSFVVPVAAGATIDLAVELPSDDGAWTLVTSCTCESDPTP